MAENTEELELTSDPAELSADPNVGVDEGDQAGADAGLVDITIGGMTYKVPSAAADAYTVEKSARQEQLNDIRSVQESSAISSEEVIQQRQGFDYEQGLFTDANATVKRIQDETEERVMAKVSAMREGEKREQKFWDSLYNKNPDLKGEDFIIKGVVAENLDSLRGLPADRVVNLIAEKSMERILGITQRHSAAPAGANDVHTTGASSPGRKKTAEQKEEDNLPDSLGDAVKRHRNRGNLKVAS